MAKNTKTDMAEEQTVDQMTQAAAPESPDDLVPVFVERGDHKGDPNLFVGINGRNWLLPRGKTSMVPRYVRDEIERSKEAKEAYYDKSEQLLAMSKQPQDL